MEQYITNEWNRCTKCLNKSVTWKAHKLLRRLMYFSSLFSKHLEDFFMNISDLGKKIFRKLKVVNRGTGRNNGMKLSKK